METDTLIAYSPYAGEGLGYFDFLIGSVEQNYENSNYHFAAFALHMYFMSAMYLRFWQVMLLFPQRYKDSLTHLFVHNNKIDMELPQSAFEFSNILERSVFRKLKLIGASTELIAKCQKKVDVRNIAAHANGNIMFGDNAELFEDEVLSYIGLMEEVKLLIVPHLLDYLDSYLEEYIDDEINEEDIYNEISTNIIQRLQLCRYDLEYWRDNTKHPLAVKALSKLIGEAES